MSHPRNRLPEVVDLTVEPAPPRLLRKRKSTYIDLTTPESASPTVTVETGDTGRIEILYESRSTPIPPSRLGRSIQQQTAHVDLADDSDSDLPNVYIPGKRSKPATPPPPVDIPSCPVCLETVPELQAKNIGLIITTSCRHFFCEPCIKESLKAAKLCPRCRGSLRRKVPYQKFFF